MVDEPFRRLRRIHGGRLRGRTGPAARAGANGILAQDSGASELRRVLAAASDGQNSGRAAAEGAGDVRAQFVGPGRYLWSAGALQGVETERHRERQSFSGDGAVASRTRDR